VRVDPAAHAAAEVGDEALLLAAARVGSTRLIDNVQLVLGGGS